MIYKTEFRIEGLDSDGAWHLIDRPADYLPDPMAHRDNVAKILRKNAVRRYSKVRLVKYVTTIEVIGEDITV